MDPPSDNKWGAYALNYYAFMQWNGEGTIPPIQQRQLENLVNGAHQLGRQVRLYGSPRRLRTGRPRRRRASTSWVEEVISPGIAAAFAQ